MSPEMKNSTRLYKCLAALSVGVFFLMVLGATVRNMGAGLACPDWPLCHGQIIPPMDAQIFIEWFHRLTASMVSFGLIGVAFLILRRAEYRNLFGKNLAASFLLLAAQVVLGGLTVIGLLKSEIVTSHLAVGFLFFGTILWMSLRARGLNNNLHVVEDRKSVKFSRFALMAAFVVYFQVLLGGSVASNYAGMACPDFPTCNGDWIPRLEGLVTFQFLHRLGALLVFLKVSMLLMKSIRLRLPSHLSNWVKIVGILLVLQIAVGISSVFLNIPLALSVAHLGIAAALFAALLVVSYEAARVRLH